MLFALPGQRPGIGALVIVLALGCACPTACSTAAESVSPGAAAATARINPANIRRIAGELPPGYEVAKVTGVSAPAQLWGLRPAATVRPPQCAALTDPADGRARSAQGVSGSGGGGILDAVVVAPPSGPVTPDPNVVTQCTRFTMSTGHTRAGVRLVDAPRIDGVATLGIAGDITTSVEGGAEIVSHAYAFTAYLGDYYAFTTLITEPGSTDSPLTPQFAADLLVKTVSALRR
ncbi:MAG: DUF5642 family protein [Mycobacterium sp.]|uniref:DUF5642 family protein n=1 Tax=Mycobacterium sp. TaxID=1785 RepID=UPI002612576B|nr:DUF5642 family protein [Mycobacterium sp.]MDI3314944.1 DUF5642 family protein [Mycobacterium sp.]